MDTRDTIDPLRAEAARLRSETASLEDAVARARRTSQRLERIIAAIPGIVWESAGTLGQPDYRITYVGGQIERILGYTAEEWRRTPGFWLSVVHPDDRDAVMRDVVEEGRPPEFRLLAKDGREVWVMPRVRVLHDASGARTGTSIFAMDVTERVLAERARKGLLDRTQALAERLDNLVASVPGVVWESRGTAEDPMLRPVFFSSYLTTLTGYLPAEAEGSEAAWQMLSHPDDLEQAGREIVQRLREGGGSVEYRWITRDGAIMWVESHVRPIHSDGGEIVGASGVTMDVTARKLAEDEQDRLEDEVLRAQSQALAELSAPLIPISAQVLVMPLIGAIDTQRAHNVIEVLLHGVRKARARVAILDITGVSSIDTHTADTLLRAARAVALLGAEAVLAGIRPDVAATLVALRADLSEVATCSTLESALQHAASRGAIAPRTVT